MQHCARRCAQCEAEKDRASQKQRSDFLAASVHKAPPGRQKSEREFCLPGGVFLRSACRAVCRGWSFLRGLPFLRRLLRPVPRRFFCQCVAALVLACGSLLLLCLAWSGLRCLPFALRALVCAGFSFLFFAISCLTFASQKFFHLSLRPRRASTFFRKESRQRFARGAARRSPSNPIPAPCGQSSPLPRCWPAYAAFQAANRRLTGKRLKSPGAELSFSSVSVRRRTPAPFRRSPLFPRCWPAYTALRAANRRLAWETPEKPRSKAQLFGRFCAWGNGWPHVLHIHGSLGRAFARRVSSRPQGTRVGRKPAQENRSSAWDHTRNQPRACAAGRKHKHGA